MRSILVKVAERICYGFGFGIGMGTAWRLLPMRERQPKNIHEGSTGIRTRDARIKTSSANLYTMEPDASDGVRTREEIISRRS